MMKQPSKVPMAAASTTVVVAVGVLAAIFPSDSNFELKPGFDSKEDNGYIFYNQGLGNKGGCAEGVFLEDSPNHIAELISDFEDSSIVVMVSTSKSKNSDPMIIVEHVETGVSYCSNEIIENSGEVAGFEVNNNVEVEFFSIDHTPSDGRIPEGFYKVWVADRSRQKISDKLPTRYDILVAEQENFYDFEEGSYDFEFMYGE